MVWGIVVLAAGMSSRMGRQKLLLDWGGTTVLGRVLETLAAAAGGRAPRTVAVAGCDEEAIGAELARIAKLLGPSLRIGRALNPDFRNGQMIDSVRVGLSALPEEAETALIVLGDQPQLSVEAARGVLEAAERSGAPIVAPVHRGRRGHPWAVARGLWDELGRAASARDFLEARRADIEEIAADFTVLKDLDSPEDYRREADALAKR